jgi:predicted NACHT family NTPase
MIIESGKLFILVLNYPFPHAIARKVEQAKAFTQIKDDFVAQFNRGLVWLLLDGVDEMQATVGNALGEYDWL